MVLTGPGNQPKGYPLETIFNTSGPTNGNMEILVRVNKTIIFRVGGSPETPLVQHPAHNAFQRVSRNDFFSIFCRFGLQMGSRGRSHEESTKLFFGYFSKPASFEGLQGSPGSPKHLQDYKMIQKMNPK